MSFHLKDNNYWKPIRASSTRENTLCSRLVMKDHLVKENYARSCKEIEELKRRCYQEKYRKKRRRLEEFLAQHDQESRTVSLFFYDLDLLSSYDVFTFLIKFLLPRVQESPAAKLECCEVYERGDEYS